MQQMPIRRTGSLNRRHGRRGLARWRNAHRGSGFFLANFRLLRIAISLSAIIKHLGGHLIISTASTFISAAAISTAIVSTTIVSTPATSTATSSTPAASSSAALTSAAIIAARLLLVVALLILRRTIAAPLMLRAMLPLTLILGAIITTASTATLWRAIITLHIALLRAIHVLATTLLAALRVLGSFFSCQFHRESLSQRKLCFAPRSRGLIVRHLLRAAAPTSTTASAPTATTSPAATSTAAASTAASTSTGLFRVRPFVRNAAWLELNFLFVIILRRNWRLVPSRLVRLLAHGFLRFLAQLFRLFFLFVTGVAGIRLTWLFVGIFFNLLNFFRLIVRRFSLFFAL
jgi:hypothetical protein